MGVAGVFSGHCRGLDSSIRGKHQIRSYIFPCLWKSPDEPITALCTRWCWLRFCTHKVSSSGLSSYTHSLTRHRGQDQDSTSQNWENNVSKQNHSPPSMLDESAVIGKVLTVNGGPSHIHTLAYSLIFVEFLYSLSQLHLKFTYWTKSFVSQKTPQHTFFVFLYSFIATPVSWVCCF